MNTVVVPLGIQPPFRHNAPRRSRRHSAGVRETCVCLCVSVVCVCVCLLVASDGGLLCTPRRTNKHTHTQPTRPLRSIFCGVGIWPHSCSTLHPLRLPLSLLSCVACCFAGGDDSFVCCAPLRHVRACTRVFRMNDHWESFMSSGSRHGSSSTHGTAPRHGQ